MSGSRGGIIVCEYACKSEEVQCKLLHLRLHLLGASPIQLVAHKWKLWLLKTFQWVSKITKNSAKLLDVV